MSSIHIKTTVHMYIYIERERERERQRERGIDRRRFQECLVDAQVTNQGGYGRPFRVVGF